MTSKTFALALSAALSGVLPTISYAASVAASFEGLGFFPNESSSNATGVSGDGSVAVGYAPNFGNGGAAQAFSWSGGVMTSLGSLNPTMPTFNQAFGTNSNGSVVVGMSNYPFNGPSNYAYQAFRYSGGTMTGLGFLSGLSGAESIANGVSGNGSVVVGWSQSSNGAVTPGDRYEAFRWTGGTMSGLGYLPGASRSIATGTNSDGSVVVGWGDTNSTHALEAFRWTAATGMVGLGFLPSGGLSQATATNADGSVVVGNTDQGEAFAWTAKKGMVGLSGLGQANAVSANGSVVVGQTSGEAMVWTHQTGAESIQQLLLADGINLTGWLLEDATGISADGTVIVGDGIDPQGNNEAWIADIPHIRNLPQNLFGTTALLDPMTSTDPVAPIPTALPLFATGLGALGLLGWRRKRKAQAATN